MCGAQTMASTTLCSSCNTKAMTRKIKGCDVSSCKLLKYKISDLIMKKLTQYVQG
jgi:hypothetical protein